MHKIHSLLALLLITVFACAQQTETEIIAEESINLEYTTELVVPELTIPWGMTFLPDGSMLITEKSGTLVHFKDGVKTNIEGTPEVYVRGQGGFLDIKAHPDYENNGWIYMTYSSQEGEGDGGNTGYLYFSIGDRGNRDVNPQDITRDCGKIYRLHDDGRIPEDNPFVGTTDAKTAIYSYGHRNPQGMTKHPVTGAIWVNEHGPQGGDEINIIEKGKNFGWPVISYGINYSGTTFTDITEKEGMEQPLFYWVPSIAPSGMAIVSSENYPDWTGNVLVGSLKFSYLERLIIEDGIVVKREKLFEDIGRVRNVVEAPDGFIYVAFEGKGIYKIVSK